MNQAYFWSLADEPADTVQAAVREWMRTEKWFPKPAELIALANDIGDQLVREGVKSLPTPERKFTSLAKLLELRQKMVSMSIGTDKVDDAIADARIREGKAA